MRMVNKRELDNATREILGNWQGEFTNREATERIMAECIDLVQPLAMYLARAQVSELVRHIAKELCLIPEDGTQMDFGFPSKIPARITVPQDPTQPLANADCRYVPIREATIADLDAHIAMLDAQIKADQGRRNVIYALRLHVASVVGDDPAATVGQAMGMLDS